MDKVYKVVSSFTGELITMHTNEAAAIKESSRYGAVEANSYGIKGNEVVKIVEVEIERVEE